MKLWFEEEEEEEDDHRLRDCVQDGEAGELRDRVDALLPGVGGHAGAGHGAVLQVVADLGFVVNRLILNTSSTV